MQNILVNMYEKFRCDRLRNDRALGNRKSDNNKSNNNNNNNNVRSHWRPVSGTKNTVNWLWLVREPFMLFSADIFIHVSMVERKRNKNLKLIELFTSSLGLDHLSSRFVNG